MKTLSALLQSFRGLHALVIGDAMLDSYLEGQASRLCREGPVPIVRKTAEFHFPGGAANTAANLRSLGARVTFLGLIGRDIPGTQLRHALERQGIDIDGLLESPTGSTLHKMRILADGQYVVRLDEGELRQGERIDPLLEQILLDKIEAGYRSCDLVVVSDYSYGVISEAVVERLRVLQETDPKILVIDAKHPNVFSRVPATIMTPNYAEAYQALKGEQGQVVPPVGDLESVAVLGKGLLKRMATEHIAITLGDQGVLLVGRQGLVSHIPAYPIAHANDIGAGDSFASALALALAAGGTVEESARLGCEAACIAVSRRWTALVSLQELQQRLEQRTALPEALDTVRQVTLAELVDLLEMPRQQGQRIVFTNGIFDILHIGHIRLLRQAKMLGDILIVGLNSDACTRRLKGEGRPINNERERMAVVEALDVVDYVLLFDEETPIEVIRQLRPHVHVKGGDYTHKELPEASVVRAGGGTVVILPFEDGKSTSSTIARIREMTGHVQSLPVVHTSGGDYDR